MSTGSTFARQERFRKVCDDTREVRITPDEIRRVLDACARTSGPWSRSRCCPPSTECRCC
jgi:hypothetical protein